MKSFRNTLPTPGGTVFITDGGLETTLIYHYQMKLPHFAAFYLLSDEKGKIILKDYFESYLQLAKKYAKGFILESPTWRASSDWGYKLGYSQNELHDLNQSAIHELRKLKRAYESEETPVLISGCLGPRGDGYVTSQKMNITKAENYHKLQVSAFQKAKVDLLTGITLNYSEEAIGMVKAAMSFNLPIVISFTVETDGKLPSGEFLNEAIQQVDEVTAEYPSYYMINCAHPSHFINQLENSGTWISRIYGIRANASLKSHEELDNSTALDAGDKIELAERYKELQNILPNLIVYGGCCGTDHNHIDQICQKCFTNNPVLDNK